MDPIADVLVFFLLLAIFLISGVWIYLALMLTSFLSLLILLDFSWHRIGVTFYPVIIRGLSSPELAAIPLFVFIGEIISRTSIAARLFFGLKPLVSRLPGGLLHVNILGSVLFAAFSGSSTATTATIARVTLHELSKNKYDQGLSLGSICVPGTIGIMIPPSITMIIYGIIAEVSIAKVFAAGMIPGIILGMMYSTYIIVRCIMSPELAPRAATRSHMGEIISGLVQLCPIFFLIAAILGSIYGGIATPSEAAAVGVVVSLIIAAAFGDLSLDLFAKAAMGTVVITGMLGIIIAGAAVLASAVGYLHLTGAVIDGITGLHLSPIMLIVVLTGFYVALGTALDGISMILMTVPFTLPLVEAAGFDPIWFGVYVILVVEIGLVTPPVGLNLFVMQAVTGVRQGRIALASLPFVLLMLLAAAVFVAFPMLALWLPGLIG